MHCEHEHEDGAYVLGALSPAERVAYERHLATCSFCREAVRDISTLPDLLSRLDAKEFAKLVDPTLSAPRPTNRHTTGRRSKAKALRVRVLSTTAAAVFVILAGLGVVLWTRDSAPAATPPGPAIAMTAVDGESPIAATIRLTSKTGGTQVEMVCSYSPTAAGRYTFSLVAYGPDKEKEQLGSWTPAPGTEFPMKGMTHFAGGSLSRLELVQYDGKVLLAYDVP
jgi:anti-sigma-K factor RskA